jgi:hypothetical protein
MKLDLVLEAAIRRNDAALADSVEAAHNPEVREVLATK